MTPGFPKDEKETQCIPAMQLFLSQLSQFNEVDISVIALEYPYQRRTYTWKGIQVFALGGKNKGGVRKLLNWQKVSRLAVQLHKENRLDRVHSFWMSDCALIGNRISRKLSIPHSCTLMGQDVLKTNKYFDRIKPLPKLVALSEFHKRQLEANFKVLPSHVIPWGVENISSTNVRSIDVIGVGNLIDLKCFSRFLLIVQNLKKSIPEIKVEIVGEGEKLQDLLRLCDELDISENVTFVGGKNREDTLERMSHAKCLLHCSDFESFGMVLIEAQSLGVKVFSTPTGVAEEMKNSTTFTNNGEATHEMIKFLRSGSDELPLRQYKVEETVDSYLKLVL